MVNFDEHFYFPALMSRVAEVQGLRELSAREKERIVPLFTLGKWHNAIEFDRAIENCALAIGDDGRFFADLTREIRHQPDAVRELLSPDSDFIAWRNYIARFESTIPVVQMVPGATRRQVTRQAQLFERSRQQLAFRVRNPGIELPLIINALSALDDINNAVTFIDVKYIRDEERVAQAVIVDAIDRIRDELGNTRIVALSSSFPPYLGDFADDEDKERGNLETLERRLHASIVSEGHPCIYGDYASIHPIIRPSGGGGAPIPRIDLAKPFTWHFERRPTLRNTRREAYVEIASALMERHPQIKDHEAWSAQMVRRAAEGDPHGLAAASWIAVRVNMHLSEQIRYSDAVESALDLDEDL